MKSIITAKLVWIYSLEYDDSKSYEKSDSPNAFMSLIDAGDRSEYSPSYYEQIKRKELISDRIIVDGCEIKLTVVESTYSNYRCSLIHIFAELDAEKGVSKNNYAKLISGSSILEQKLINANASLNSALKKIGAIINGSSFLINQIRETSPALPKDILVDSQEFIQSNVDQITQFLLRSDTDAKFISSDNHKDYLVNTSSFKGSVDLYSASTMVQFYFSDLVSLSESKIITADVRLSWTCSVITMLNIQSMILKSAIKSIDDMGKMEASKKISRTKELKKILVGLREYWGVDAMVHPMTAKKVNIYKEIMGVTRLFETLNYRMESTENLALRELSEIQNEQDQILNYILLFIASIQIVPFAYEIIKKVSNDSYQFEFTHYGATIAVSVFLPLLILKMKSIRRRVNGLFVGAGNQ